MNVVLLAGCSACWEDPDSRRPLYQRPHLPSKKLQHLFCGWASASYIFIFTIFVKKCIESDVCMYSILNRWQFIMLHMWAWLNAKNCCAYQLFKHVDCNIWYPKALIEVSHNKDWTRGSNPNVYVMTVWLVMVCCSISASSNSSMQCLVVTRLLCTYTRRQTHTYTSIIVSVYRNNDNKYCGVFAAKLTQRVYITGHLANTLSHTQGRCV